MICSISFAIILFVNKDISPHHRTDWTWEEELDEYNTEEDITHEEENEDTVADD